MTNLFVLSTNQELYQTTDPIHSQLTDLMSIFPTSSWLKTQRALLYYHARDFVEAESIFDELTKSDPHRLDSLDHYSNILYVMERRPKLGFDCGVGVFHFHVFVPHEGPGGEEGSVES